MRHNSCGIGPESALLSRVKIIKPFILLIEAGMVPLKELVSNRRSIRLWQLLIASGIDPDKLFPAIYKYASFVRLPTSGGRGPMKLLYAKSRANDRDDMFKVTVGNRPVNLLLLNVATVKSWRLPRLVGRAPLNMLWLV